MRQGIPMRFPLGEMTVGDLLDRGLEVLFARLPVLFAIQLVVLLPLIVFQVAAPLVVFAGPFPRDTDPRAVALGGAVLELLLALVLQPIATAAVLFVVMEQYAGRRPALGAALAFALGRAVPLLGASIVLGVFVVVGLCLLVVPGLYLWTTYALVGHAIVLERLGVRASFRRSRELVSGYRTRAFWMLLLVLVAARMAERALEGGLDFAWPRWEFVPVEGGVRGEINVRNQIIAATVLRLVGVLFATYAAVCATLLYIDLRVRKEGFDLELAAGVAPRHRARAAALLDGPGKPTDDLPDDSRGEISERTVYTGVRP
jgi:hypothetical protein